MIRCAPLVSLLAVLSSVGPRRVAAKRSLRGDGTFVCLTKEQCLHRSKSNGGSRFIVGDFVSKGCFEKGGNVFFGTGGTVEEMSTTDLPKKQSRVWCGGAAEVPPVDQQRQQPAPTDPQDEAATTSSYYHQPQQFADLGNDGLPKRFFPLGMCEGDCDSDDECEVRLFFAHEICLFANFLASSCFLRGGLLTNLLFYVSRHRQDGLACFQRDDTEPVPGCFGEGSYCSDYCYKPPEAIYQAENAKIDSMGTKVGSDNADSDNGSYVDFGREGSYVEFTVDGGSNGGQCALSFKFANGSIFSRPCALQVNGLLFRTKLAFVTTSSWDEWRYETVHTTCSPGQNVIRITAMTIAGGPNVDSLEVYGLASDSTREGRIRGSSRSPTRRPSVPPTTSMQPSPSPTTNNPTLGPTFTPTYIPTTRDDGFSNWNHGSYASSEWGGKIKIYTPSGTQVGDTLFLFLR